MEGSSRTIGMATINISNIHPESKCCTSHCMQYGLHSRNISYSCTFNVNYCYTQSLNRRPAGWVTCSSIRSDLTGGGSMIASCSRYLCRSQRTGSWSSSTDVSWHLSYIDHTHNVDPYSPTCWPTFTNLSTLLQNHNCTDITYNRPEVYSLINTKLLHWQQQPFCIDSTC